MLPLIIVSFLYLSQTTASPSLTPLALIDDATDSFHDLSDTVSGYMSVANLKLDDLMFEAKTLRNNVELQGEFDLMEHDQRMKTQYTQILQLSVVNKVNITSCVAQGDLEGLSDFYFDALEMCLSASDVEAEGIQQDGEYRVDVYATNVLQWQFHLTQCKGDEACLNQYIGDVKNQTVEMPLRIQDETAKTQQSVRLHESHVNSCVTTNLKAYAAAATDVVFALHDCLYKDS